MLGICVQETRDRGKVQPMAPSCVSVLACGRVRHERHGAVIAGAAMYSSNRPRSSALAMDA
jgi:hypothetical protein